ncbi:MAG: glycine dehydrogenase (aminomethyl-transferring), partial [Bacteroidales bacterium]|nr:glycine dehydrogenase (aminomethyl-transferring) [Bacteroidales bacterium]
MSHEMFANRHNGPRGHEISQMLKTVGVESLDELMDKTVPSDIRLPGPLNLPPAMNEYEYLAHLRELGSRNKLYRSFIGQGYYGVAPPSVIVRNVLENPSWYTSYTPYQAEISQGRLEALINFQTMVIELTGMEIANASLLDEATAAAEAMIMMFNARSREAVKTGVRKFFADEDVFPQTLDVIRTRAMPLGIEVVTGKYNEIIPDNSFFGYFVQYPSASGEVKDYSDFAARVHETGALLGVAADLMSLALLVPPGEWGADIVAGSSQRMGLPVSFGGPHAGYFATREALKRSMPGRI